MGNPVNHMENFIETYRKLNGDNLHLLSSIYAEDIVFIDPAHTIQGIDNLMSYFASMYSNINSASFHFNNTFRSGDQAYVQWTMEFSHPKLAGGKLISFPGVSSLIFNVNEKVIQHQDFFDMGAMLYEHLPLFGRVIKSIKKRLGT
jgi:ketosteroid isomerase-like protein